MRATPLLMFQGDAQDALMLWKRAFPNHLDVTGLERHASGETAGKVSSAHVRLGGSEWRVIDSEIPHTFTFTPATSICVECEDAAQLRHAAQVLGEGGKVMIPIETGDGEDGSALSTWLSDAHGVSWQLNLPFARGD